MNERKPYLQMAAGPVALVIVAIVLLVVSSSTVARAVALTLFGIAGVIAVSLVFFAVGRSEDAEREAAAAPPEPEPEAEVPPADPHPRPALDRRRPMPPRRPS